MGIYPHATRTDATETSRMSACVFAGKDTDRRFEGEENPRALHPAGHDDEVHRVRHVGGALREARHGRFAVQVENWI